MSRPIRIEFAHALYHVTALGDRRESIFEDDGDRQLFLEILANTIRQFNWICHAWCLMGNHYHLLIQTPDGNLSKGMRQLNGVYTQSSNRRHHRVGHVFQGRFKGILADSDAYLLELSRYLVLNPVRAGMVASPEAWAWSSYRAYIGEAPLPQWLTVGAVLSQFGGRRHEAQGQYVDFVYQGIGAESPWARLRNQVFLGDEPFVKRMQAMSRTTDEDVQIPLAQRRAPAPALADIAARTPDRDAAIVEAYATGAWSYQDIARHFGLHFTTVGRIVRGKRTG